MMPNYPAAANLATTLCCYAETNGAKSRWLELLAELLTSTVASGNIKPPQICLAKATFL